MNQCLASIVFISLTDKLSLGEHEYLANEHTGELAELNQKQ